MRERDWDRMNDVVALMRDGGELCRLEVTLGAGGELSEAPDGAE